MTGLKVGSSHVDVHGLTIETDGRITRVEPKVMDVLVTLMENPDTVLAKDEILDAVWPDTYGGEERLTRAVSLLRTALGDQSGPKASIIKTVPKRGYRFIGQINSHEPVQKTASESPVKRRGSAPSLAVLPFRNMSTNSALDVLAFGMAEDVIEALARGVDVRVKASSATARFQNGDQADLAGMAEQLKVSYVLQGNIRPLEDGVRIVAQLVEASSGDIKWSERFETDRPNLALAQEKLVVDLAGHLRRESHRVEIERALRKPTDLTAWEAVMRALGHYRQMTPMAMVMTLSEAKNAVAIDPEYGLSQAILVQIESVFYNQLTPDSEDQKSRLHNQAHKAMELDPGSSTVAAAASSALSVIGYPKDGLEAAEKAIRLNAFNQYAYFAAGLANTLLDQTEEAIPYFEKESELAPGDLTVWISHGWHACSLIRNGRWEDADKVLDQALDLTPDNAAPNLSKAIIAQHFGSENVAGHHFQKARRAELDTPLEIWLMRYARAYEGNPVKDTYLQYLRDLWAQNDMIV
ncbi:MAG: winged helix-turn-helix domain-containing protein [Pseudomonadota bacterium]